jgi:hypothetical protein
MEIETIDDSEGAAPAVRHTLDDGRLAPRVRDSDDRGATSGDELLDAGRGAKEVEPLGGTLVSAFRVGKCGSRLGVERPGGSEGGSNRGRALGSRKRVPEM